MQTDSNSVRTWLLTELMTRLFVQSTFFLLMLYIRFLCSPKKFNSIHSNATLMEQLQEDASRALGTSFLLLAPEKWDDWYSGL